MGYIYKITNIKDKKIYIGQTSRTVEERWKEHVWDSCNKNGLRYASYLHSAIRKHGVESFVLETIEECDNSLLDEREIYWIDFYKTLDSSYGYNMQEGGHNNYIRVPESLETRRKKSTVQMGSNNSFWGKHHNNLHRSQISTPVVAFTDEGDIYRYYVSQISAKIDGYQQSHITDCVNGKSVHHGKTSDGKRLKWRNATDTESEVIKICFVENNMPCLTRYEYLEFCKGA